MDTFEEYRTYLFAIAYRMLGSVSDAEDMVQEAYLRFQRVDKAQVASPKAYLSTIVTRLCLDYLKSAQVQREQYFGPWLPEPLLITSDNEPARTTERLDSISFAFLVLLEKLTPHELAVINGQQGFIGRMNGEIVGTLVLDIQAGHIQRIWSVRNPDKLKHLMKG